DVDPEKCRSLQLQFLLSTIGHPTHLDIAGQVVAKLGIVPCAVVSKINGNEEASGIIAMLRTQGHYRDRRPADRPLQDSVPERDCSSQWKGPIPLRIQVLIEPAWVGGNLAAQLDCSPATVAVSFHDLYLHLAALFVRRLSGPGEVPADWEPVRA